jgi:hypothetical protein
MLAGNNNTGVIAQPNEETTICSWISDGSSYLIGFMGTGSFSGNFFLAIGDDVWYRYHTSPGNRTAYAADRGRKIPPGTEVTLKVLHDGLQAEKYYGTILGGE